MSKDSIKLSAVSNNTIQSFCFYTTYLLFT